MGYPCDSVLPLLGTIFVYKFRGISWKSHRYNRSHYSASLGISYWYSLVPRAEATRKHDHIMSCTCVMHPVPGIHSCRVLDA